MSTCSSRSAWKNPDRYLIFFSHCLSLCVDVEHRLAPSPMLLSKNLLTLFHLTAILLGHTSFTKVPYSQLFLLWWIMYDNHLFTFFTPVLVKNHNHFIKNRLFSTAFFPSICSKNQNYSIKNRLFKPNVPLQLCFARNFRNFVYIYQIGCHALTYSNIVCKWLAN